MPETDGLDLVPDHRLVLREAGVEVLSDDPAPHWEESFRARARAHLDEIDGLAMEIDGSGPRLKRE